MEKPPWDLTQPPDVAVQVALQEEFRELGRALGTAWHPKKNEEYGGNDYYWIDPDTGYRCVAASSGRMGPDEAVRLAERLLRFYPAIIVNVGIAASLHADARIGDVVVPDMVFAYDKTGKAITVKEGAGETWRWERRGDAFRAKHSLVEAARELETAHADRHTAWQDEGAREYALIRGANLEAIQAIEAVRQLKVLRTRPEVRVVYLASGNFVGASAAFATWLREANADVKALEMEAAGMLLAAEKRENSTPALIIRGISDHVDVPKARTDEIAEGAFRGLAMRNAVRLLRTLMKVGELPRHVATRSTSASTITGPPAAKAPEAATGLAELLDALESAGVFRTLAQLFDNTLKLENLLRRSGLDRSSLPPLNTPTPKDWWQHLVSLVRDGIVAHPHETVRALMREALSEYPGNSVLQRAKTRAAS